MCMWAHLYLMSGSWLPNDQTQYIAQHWNETLHLSGWRYHRNLLAVSAFAASGVPKLKNISIFDWRKCDLQKSLERITVAIRSTGNKARKQQVPWYSKFFLNTCMTKAYDKDRQASLLQKAGMFYPLSSPIRPYPTNNDNPKKFHNDSHDFRCMQLLTDCCLGFVKKAQLGNLKQKPSKTLSPSYVSDILQQVTCQVRVGSCHGHVPTIWHGIGGLNPHPMFPISIPVCQAAAQAACKGMRHIEDLNV